jgi:hypothetical protein
VKVRHDPAPLYEPIAAFNVDSVAARYAEDCHAANPRNTYIVEELPEPRRVPAPKVIRTFRAKESR